MAASRRILVVGLGRSGRAAARFLLARGEQVTATDSQPADKLGPEVAALGAAGVRLVCGGHDPHDFQHADTIVVSPGVPLELPPLAEAIQRGVPVISEIDLVAGGVGNRLIAITGSNGKTTTTALVAAMFCAAGREGVACGNYGVPLVDAVNGDHPQRWYALEISSFQLDTTSEVRAAAGILLNIQADHIDRHGSFEAYRESKFKIARLRLPGAPLVLMVDDRELAEFARTVAPPVLRVSTKEPEAEGGFIENGVLYLRHAGTTEKLAQAAELSLPGRHNRENILAAAAAVRATGVSVDTLRKAVLGFKALPHRLQDVALVRGVRFIDDSKATNVGSVLVALEAVRERLNREARIFVLLGGRDKDSDFRPLVAALNRADAQAVTFGEAGPKIADILQSEGFPWPHRRGSLEDAIGFAHTLARSGDVVLLSPACASFDAFTGYAARGEAFAAAARALAAEPPP